MTDTVARVMSAVIASVEALVTTLAQRPRMRVSLPDYRHAAVLVPLVLPEGAAALDEARVIFTVRRDDLRTHAGQISFPGGGQEPNEDLPLTALREAEEEIGLPRARVRVLGLLDDVPTVPSRYVITPVVGLVHGALDLVPQQREVAATFDCTLRELGDPSIYREGVPVVYLGKERVMHEYHVAERRVWGATARIVWQLLDALSSAQK